MRRIPLQSNNLGSNEVHVTVEAYPQFARPALTSLNDRTWRIPDLATDEQHFMPRIAKHGFEVIDNTPTRAYAIAGNHNRWPASTLQIIDHLLMPGVAIDTYQLSEAKRLAPFAQPLAGFIVPIMVQLPISLGDALSQWRVELVK